MRYILLLFILASCSKSDKDEISTSTWYINGSKHTAVSTARVMPNFLRATESPQSVVSIGYNAFPAVNSQQTISSGGNVGEVYLTVHNGLNEVYVSHNANIKMTSTIQNGKIIASIPTVTLYKAGDSIAFSGTIIEN